MASDLSAVLARLEKITPGPWSAIQLHKEFAHVWGVIAIEPMRGRIDSQITGMTEADAFATSLLHELIAVAKAAAEFRDYALAEAGFLFDEDSGASATGSEVATQLDAALSALANAGGEK